MDVKRAVSIASFLGGLFYTGLSYAQETPGFSQPDAETDSSAAMAPPAGTPSLEEEKKVCPPAATSSASAKAPSRTGKACANFYGAKYACVTPSVADTLGLTNRVENKDRKNYTQRDADACPSNLVCAGPMENQEELTNALDTANQEKTDLEDRIKKLEAEKADLDDFDSFVLGLKENCRGAYDQFNVKLNEVKSNYSTAVDLGKKIKETFSEEKTPIKLTPGQVLGETALPEAPAQVSGLFKQYDQASEKYQKSKLALDKERKQLSKEGCGKTKVIKEGGHFVAAPFVQYSFSADAENQGQLGISAGYQTGRWTFGGRAAATLQYADVYTDTDKSNEQTVALPGGVIKTSSDVTKTTTEEKDYAAVGPTVSYTIGRVELSAGLDALIGQKRTTEDYLGVMELTKDGQTLDGKKQVDDSTTKTETQFGVYPHLNVDVQLWKKLYGGLEGGYNTRSDSAQGAFGLKYKF